MKKLLYLFAILFSATFVSAADTLYLDAVRTVNGRELTMQVTCRSFKDILGFQGTFRYDPLSLRYLGIAPSQLPQVSPNDINETTPGTLAFLWLNIGSAGVTLPDGSILFTLRFEVLCGFDIDPVFASCPLPIEAVLNTGANVPVAGDIIEYRYCEIMTGRVLIDTDRDCVADPDETTGMPNVWLEVLSEHNPFRVLTDSSGVYRIPSDRLGTYRVRVIPPDTYWSACKDTIVLQLNRVGGAPRIADFLLQSAYDCPSLEIDIEQRPLEACADNQLRLAAANNGTVPLANGQVRIRTHEGATVTAASVPFSAVGAHEYLLEMGALPPGGSRQADITIHTDCSLLQPGALVFLAAEGIPGGICRAPGQGWRGAQLEADIRCTGDEMHFEIRNIGGGDMSAPQTVYILREDLVVHSSPVAIAAGESWQHSFVPGSGIYTILVRQEPGFPYEGMISAVAQSCIEPGYATEDYIPPFNLDDRKPFMYKAILPVTGQRPAPPPVRFEPAGYESAGAPYLYLYPDTDLTVALQRTAGDPQATQYCWQHFISDDLHISSFRPGASRQISRWAFDKGYLKIISKPVSGDEEILFRYSETRLLPWLPYHVNYETWSGSGEDMQSVATHYFQIDTGFLQLTTATIDRRLAAPAPAVYPNPVSASGDIQILAGEDAVRYAVLDLQGRMYLQGLLTGGHARISVGSLPPGVYICEVTAIGGRRAAARLVVVPAE